MFLQHFWNLTPCKTAVSLYRVCLVPVPIVAKEKGKHKLNYLLSRKLYDKLIFCFTAGIARQTANAQIPNINFTALDNLDIVCERNGLQMATYLINGRKFNIKGHFPFFFNLK